MFPQSDEYHETFYYLCAFCLIVEFHGTTLNEAMPHFANIFVYLPYLHFILIVTPPPLGFYTATYLMLTLKSIKDKYHISSMPR